MYRFKPRNQDTRPSESGPLAQSSHNLTSGSDQSYGNAPPRRHGRRPNGSQQAGNATANQQTQRETNQPAEQVPARQPAQRPDEQQRRSNVTAIGAFSELIEPLQRALADAGYHTPTPIQEKTIPHLLQGRDLLGCAQTGTGKTAAFALPILQDFAQRHHSRPRPGCPRALIMAPTRELAAQIGDSFAAYGRHLPLTHTVVFGGVKQHAQVQALKRGVDILAATPGRLLDLFQQGLLSLKDVEVFVLDEADRMLDMGFINDIRKIIAVLPKKRQSLFFSATLPTEVVSLAQTLVHDPVQVSIDPEEPAVERIVQKLMFVDKNHKNGLLTDLLADSDLDRVLVFTRMKHMANRVVQTLSQAGVSAAAIHGNKSQTARTQALDSFKTGMVRVLVATDIAARGLDVESISHVINYDLPNEPETYVHRIGRTARAGAEGDAISFCAAEERSYLSAIERLIHTTIPVDRDHPRHSENARNATGAEARPAPRTSQGRPPRSGGHQGGRRQGGGHRRY